MRILLVLTEGGSDEIFLNNTSRQLSIFNTHFMRARKTDGKRHTGVREYDAGNS